MQLKRKSGRISRTFEGKKRKAKGLEKKGKERKENEVKAKRKMFQMRSLSVTKESKKVTWDNSF